jgi:class 3 adenylate cyclase
MDRPGLSDVRSRSRTWSEISGSTCGSALTRVRWNSIGDDVRGLTVHIGSRVGAPAGPSEVLVSATVKDLVAGSGLVFEEAGEHELKGAPDRWRFYRVVGS